MASRDERFKLEVMLATLLELQYSKENMEVCLSGSASSTGLLLFPYCQT